MITVKKPFAKQDCNKENVCESQVHLKIVTDSERLAARIAGYDYILP